MPVYKDDIGFTLADFAVPFGPWIHFGAAGEDFPVGYGGFYAGVRDVVESCWLTIRVCREAADGVPGAKVRRGRVASAVGICIMGGPVHPIGVAQALEFAVYIV